MIVTKCEMAIFEVNGIEIPRQRVGNKAPLKLAVSSHWLDNGNVVVTIDDKNYTVSFSDLAAAVRACAQRGES